MPQAVHHYWLEGRTCMRISLADMRYFALFVEVAAYFDLGTVCHSCWRSVGHRPPLWPPLITPDLSLSAIARSRSDQDDVTLQCSCCGVVLVPLVWCCSCCLAFLYFTYRCTTNRCSVYSSPQQFPQVQWSLCVCVQAFLIVICTHMKGPCHQLSDEGNQL